MTCEDVMLTYVYKCHPDNSAEWCAGIMRDENVGFVPVVDGAGRLVGVVTDRDIAVCLVAQGRPGSTPVREIMSSPHLVTCQRDEEIDQVVKRLAQQVRMRALVVDDQGVCIGVLSLSDIACARPAVGMFRDVKARRDPFPAHGAD